MDYVQITPRQQEKMLERIGVESVDALFTTLPAEVRREQPLDVPGPLSELEIQQRLAELAGENRVADRSACFMGAGAYDHFIPAVVDDIAGKGQFLTAYTPYQAEASQGALQAFFEFQTQIARLAGMDVANASLYEGASAAAEAVFMAINVTGRRRVLIASTVHPHTRAVITTATADLPIELVELPATDGVTDPDALGDALNEDTAAVMIASPNVYGLIEDWSALFAATHEPKGTLAIAVFNPMACGLLKRPGECDADIAVAEGQPLGIPLQYGGPYLGLFATRDKLIRKMPGRLIGATTDSQGRRSYCLTLQTREQHIRGAKATSNICTNQGLLALRASVYLTALGPRGLRGVAERCYHKAHHAAQQIAALDGYRLLHPEAPFFNEFAVQCPVPAARIVEAGREAGLMPGVPLDRLGIGEPDQLLIAVTEKRTRAEINRLVDVLKAVTA